MFSPTATAGMLVVGDSRIVAVEDHSSYMYLSFQSEESLKKIIAQPPKEKPAGDRDVKKNGRLGLIGTNNMCSLLPSSAFD